MYLVRRFEGKNAIVTGASSGMGRAAARRLASEGARVLLVARRGDRLDQVANRIKDSGGAAYTCVADVSKSEDVRRMVARALEVFDSKIDVLINNAGVFGNVDFLELSEQDWDRVVDINMKGVFLVGQAVAREMARTGGGAIVNTSSVGGILADGDGNNAHYTASKGGVSLLTRQMAVDLIKHNIRVNAVCPGFTNTEMSPVEEFRRDDPAGYNKLVTRILMGRAGEPEEIAAAMAFLASDDASYITGELLVIDGGQIAKN